MRRTYALKRLLEHGPLTTAEIVEIMGGDMNEVLFSIAACERAGVIQAMKAERPTLKEKEGRSRIAWRNVYMLSTGNP